MSRGGFAKKVPKREAAPPAVVRFIERSVKRLDPDWFHPGKRTRSRDVKAALALCAECPVRMECLQNALEYRDPWGIWGGTTEEQRAVMLGSAA